MNLAATISLYAYGTSEGVLKEWDERGRGRKVSEELTTGKPTDQELSWIGGWGKLVSAKRPKFREAISAAAVGKDAAREVWDESGGVIPLIAKDAKGNPVGIMDLYDNSDEELDEDEEAELDEDEKSNVIVGFLATNPLVIQGVWDNVHGVGTKLMMEAAKYAAGKNAGVALSALREAIPFYEKMGMHHDKSPNVMYWTKNDVKEIAKQAS